MPAGQTGARRKDVIMYLVGNGIVFTRDNECPEIRDGAVVISRVSGG